jgi:cAMP phosphodiesterase
MRFRVLGCAGGSAPGVQLSSYLVDDVLAVDAGALTTSLEFLAQRKVQDVLLTHGHLDHIWTLPLFLANRFGGDAVHCRIHASEFTLETVRKSLFNDRIWPDFTPVVRQDVPLVQFLPLEGAAPKHVLSYEVTPCPLVHAVPCQAYRIRSKRKSLIVCGDTHRSKDLWEFASATGDLAGLVIECSFPNRLEALATTSGHLTPALLAGELSRLKPDVPVHVTHIKPEDRREVVRELHALSDDRLRILEDGVSFEV